MQGEDKDDGDRKRRGEVKDDGDKNAGVRTKTMVIKMQR